MVHASLGIKQQPCLSHMALMEVRTLLWTQARGVHSACYLLSPLSWALAVHPFWQHKQVFAEKRMEASWLPAFAVSWCPFPMRAMSSCKMQCPSGSSVNFSRLGGHLLLCTRAKILSNLCKNAIWWDRDTSESLSLCYWNAELVFFPLSKLGQLQRKKQCRLHAALHF